MKLRMIQLIALLATVQVVSCKKKEDDKKSDTATQSRKEMMADAVTTRLVADGGLSGAQANALNTSALDVSSSGLLLGAAEDADIADLTTDVTELTEGFISNLDDENVDIDADDRAAVARLLIEELTVQTSAYAEDANLSPENFVTVVGDLLQTAAENSDNAGLEGDALAEFVGELAEGAMNALEGVEVTGFSEEDYASFSAEVSGSIVEGADDLGFEADMLNDLASIVTENIISGFAGNEDIDMSFLDEVVSAFIEEMMVEFSNYDDFADSMADIVSAMTEQTMESSEGFEGIDYSELSEAATSGISGSFDNIENLSADDMTDLISASTEGIGDALENFEGLDADELAAITDAAEAGAAEIPEGVEDAPSTSDIENAANAGTETGAEEGSSTMPEVVAKS